MDIIARGMASQFSDAWSTWTPTLTWGTANPVTPATVARYKVVGKTVFFSIYISSNDGNGATNLNISLPQGFSPKANNIKHTVSAQQYVQGTGYAPRFAQIRDDGTNNDIMFPFWGTATASKAMWVSLSGFYEIA